MAEHRAPTRPMTRTSKAVLILTAFATTCLVAAIPLNDQAQIILRGLALAGYVVALVLAVRARRAAR